MRVLVTRFLQGILVLFLLETVTFFLVRALPGHPFLGEKKLPAHLLEALNASYGLDQPVWTQYWRYWRNILVDWDFGPSLTREGFGVAEIIGQAFPVSLTLGIVAMVVALAVGIPAGALAAVYRGRLPDTLLMLVALLGVCLPAFVVAPLLAVLVENLYPGWGIAGWDSPSSVVLPALTLGLAAAASLARLTRGGLAEVLGQPFIRTVEAKGASPARVIGRHALRGGLLPAVNYIGPAFAALISGSFVVETLFLVPGLGQHFVNATTDRDYFLLQALVLVYGVLIIAANLAVDLAQFWLNPRTRS